MCFLLIQALSQRRAFPGGGHHPLRQLETKPNLAKQESCLQNDCRKGGWPWLYRFKGSSSPFQGRFLSGRSGAGAGGVLQQSEKTDFRVSGGLLHGRLQARIHFYSPGLLCLSKNVCTIWALADKKIYRFKHS